MQQPHTNNNQKGYACRALANARKNDYQAALTDATTAVQMKPVWIKTLPEKDGKLQLKPEGRRRAFIPIRLVVKSGLAAYYKDTEVGRHHALSGVCRATHARPP